MADPTVSNPDVTVQTVQLDLKEDKGDTMDQPSDVLSSDTVVINLDTEATISSSQAVAEKTSPCKDLEISLGIEAVPDKVTIDRLEDLSDSSSTVTERSVCGSEINKNKQIDEMIPRPVQDPIRNQFLEKNKQISQSNTDPFMSSDRGDTKLFQKHLDQSETKNSASELRSSPDFKVSQTNYIPVIPSDESPEIPCDKISMVVPTVLDTPTVTEDTADLETVPSSASPAEMCKTKEEKVQHKPSEIFDNLNISVNETDVPTLNSDTDNSYIGKPDEEETKRCLDGQTSDLVTMDCVEDEKKSINFSDSHDHETLHSCAFEEHVHLCMDELSDSDEELPHVLSGKVGNSSVSGKDILLQTDGSTLTNSESCLSKERVTRVNSTTLSDHPTPAISSSERVSGIVQMHSSCSEMSDMVGILQKCVSRLQQLEQAKEEGDSSVFDNLPPELQVKIFSYLTVQEICTSVSPVCQEWRLLSHDPSLWKSISFYHSPNLETMKLIWCLGRAPHLRKLVLSGRSNLTVSEVEIFTSSCSMLQNVNLGFCDGLDCFIMKVLVKNCTELQVLNVEGCQLVDSNCVKLISELPKITDLNFSHCPLMDEDINYLASNVNKIHSLNIDGISWITDESVASLTEHHKDNLLSLYIDGAELSDISVLRISQCTHLTHLAISFCDNLTDTGLFCLQSLSSLESLKLRKGSDLTADGLMTAFRKGNFLRLQSLDLSECTRVNDTVTLQIVQCCGKNLRFLALGWCWNITDTGLVSIVDHCGQLEHLDLLGIEKITGVCLSRVPEEITHLTFLDLRQCNKIVDSLIIDVVRRKPDLLVINYYGEEILSAMR